MSAARTPLAAAAAALLLMLAGCGFVPKSGKVLDSWHEPYSLVVMSICSGNPAICSMIPIETPEAWYLKIESDEPKHKGKQGYRDVPHGVYDRCWTGDHYPDCATRGHRPDTVEADQ